MNVSHELREAVQGISEEEAIMASYLSEGTAAAIGSGFYTDGVLEEVFMAIYQTYGLTEEDWPDIEAAINEFVDEHWVDDEDDLLDEAKRAKPKMGVAKNKKPGLISRALSWVGREAAKQAEKRLSGVKAQKGTVKHKLVHAARGALKQYASGRKGKAAEIAKRSAGKLVTKGAKSAVRKGMKMVFGTWRKTDNKPGGAAKPAGEAPKSEPKPEPKPEPKKKRRKKSGEAPTMRFQGGGANEERMYEQAGMPKAPKYMNVVKVGDGFDVWANFEYFDQFVRAETKYEQSRRDDVLELLMQDRWEKADDDVENVMVGHVQPDGDKWSAELSVQKPFNRERRSGFNSPENAVKWIDNKVDLWASDKVQDFYSDFDKDEVRRAERRGYW